MDPHTFQQIIRRIEQQMRCPQCGKRIPVLFPAVRMAANDFLLLQLKCDTCEAYIVLHASLQGLHHFQSIPESQQFVNASSSLQLKDEELASLRTALEQNGGSFEKMFKKVESGPAAPTDTRIA
ncbi:MAG: hypothetical protein HOO67_07630 [Candidatus Peribacteraceae bacterium]|nr:hypothetical protein [Candidatus Peribacteraceae bacterium]